MTSREARCTRRTRAAGCVGTRWEDHARAEGLSRSTIGFWDAAWSWIAEQQEPKRDMGAEGDDGQVYGG